MRLGRSKTNVALSLCTRLSAIPARLEGVRTSMPHPFHRSSSLLAALPQPHTSHPAATWWWHGDALAAMSSH